MRTTLVLDDRLIRTAKELAAERRTSLGAVVNDALREYVAGAGGPEKRVDFRMPVFGDAASSVDLDPTEIDGLDATMDLDEYVPG